MDSLGTCWRAVSSLAVVKMALTLREYILAESFILGVEYDDNQSIDRLLLS
jgi:hypothetical protein